ARAAPARQPEQARKRRLEPIVAALPAVPFTAPVSDSILPKQGRSPDCPSLSRVTNRRPAGAAELGPVGRSGGTDATGRAEDLLRQGRPPADARSVHTACPSPIGAPDL